jgi:hypothetical protein
MAISFHCNCGKKLAAKDDFAGRRLKCPGCGEVLTIPGHPTAATPELTPAGKTEAMRSRVGKTASTIAAFVRFACDCGRKMKAYRGDIGSEVDCPRCGRELTIPAKDGTVVIATATEVAPPLKKRLEAPLPAGRDLAPTMLQSPVDAATPAPTKNLPTPPPLTVKAAPAPPPITTKAVPAPPPITTKAAPAPPPITTKAAAATVHDPETSPPGPAPATIKAVNPPIALAITTCGDSLVTQYLTPWRNDEVRRQAGKPPAESKVRSRFMVPLAVLLVTGVIAAEWFLVHQSRGSQQATSVSGGNLPYIPSDAISVVTYHVAEILNDKDRPAKGMKEQVRLMFDAFEKKHGMKWNANDIDRVTQVLMLTNQAPQLTPVSPIGPGKQPAGKQPKAPAAPKAQRFDNDDVTIIQTLSPYQKDDMLRRILDAGATLDRAAPVRVGKFIYWKPAKSDVNVAVFFPDQRTIVRGDIASIDHFVRVLNKVKPGPFVALGKTIANHDAAAAINLTFRTPFKRGAMPPPHLAFLTASMLRDDSTAEGKRGQTLLLELVYEDAVAAEQAKKVLDKMDFKVPPQEAQAKVSGSTVRMNLPVMAKNQTEIDALMGSIMGVVNRKTELLPRG